jgi:hypothetical protein
MPDFRPRTKGGVLYLGGRESSNTATKLSHAPSPTEITQKLVSQKPSGLGFLKTKSAACPTKKKSAENKESFKSEFSILRAEWFGEARIPESVD